MFLKVLICGLLDVFGSLGIIFGSRIISKQVSEPPNIDLTAFVLDLLVYLTSLKFSQGGWVAGKFDFNENPVVQLGLGLPPRVCQYFCDVLCILF